MRFHIPPTLQWDPDALARQLNTAQLNAIAEKDIVRVRQGPFEIRDFPCVWRIRVYEPSILIEHYPERYLYNGHIEAEFGKFSVEEDLEVIKNALNGAGYTTFHDGDLDSEFAIVRSYLLESQGLKASYVELRRLDQEKNDAVSHQEFEKAVRIRDQQDAIRKSLDQLAVSLFRRS